MALFFDPSPRYSAKARAPKPMSKTALKKALRELRACIREWEQADPALARAMKNAVNMLETGA
jgi:hypothetical protein